MVGDDGFLVIQEKPVAELRIPQLSLDTLTELSKRIQPIIRFGNTGRYFIKPVGPFVVYTRDPELSHAADDLRLCELKRIKTLHAFGYRSIFNPFPAEVLAQIPEEDLDRVVAYEIIRNSADDPSLDPTGEACASQMHYAETVLYTRP